MHRPDLEAEIERVEDFIDCDKKSLIPEGLLLLPENEQLPNRVCWKLAFLKISLYLSERQKNVGTIKGDDLLEELKEIKVFTDHVLDFLLRNENLIPEQWKGKKVFFWGSLFRNPDGYVCVRYLCWRGGAWDWGIYQLDYEWHDSPAAVLHE